MDTPTGTCPLSEQLAIDLGTLILHIGTAALLEQSDQPDQEEAFGHALAKFGRHLTRTGERVISASGRRSR